VPAIDNGHAAQISAHLPVFRLKHELTRTEDLRDPPLFDEANLRRKGPPNVISDAEIDRDALVFLVELHLHLHLVRGHLGNWGRVVELVGASERGSRDCDLDGIFRLLISRFNIKPFRELAFREPRLG